MKTINFILIFPLFTLILGCEGSRIGKGIICDIQTQIPLDSVKFKDINETIISYSDSTGSYTIEGPFGGCISECPDYKVEFSKEGYKTKIVENPDGYIFLEIE